MGFLRVLRLGGVFARRGGDVAVAIVLADDGAGGVTASGAMSTPSVRI